MKFTKYEKYGPYHWDQYERGTKYRRHADRVKEWVTETNALDIGAGDGKITALLDIKGIDSEPEAVRLAKLMGADVSLGDAYNLSGEYDSALMIDVLEHLEVPGVALREVHKVIRKYLYITTPPKRDDGKLTDKFHYREYTPDELKKAVEEQGFILEGEILVIPEEKVMYAKFKKL